MSLKLSQFLATSTHLVDSAWITSYLGDGFVGEGCTVEPKSDPKYTRTIPVELCRVSKLSCDSSQHLEAVLIQDGRRRPLASCRTSRPNGSPRAKPNRKNFEVASNFLELHHHIPHAQQLPFEMELHAAEIKVPIRLTTRDPSIELTQDAGVMLVQTCKSKGVELEQPTRDALWYA
jgi:hypothetical protein